MTEFDLSLGASYSSCSEIGESPVWVRGSREEKEGEGHKRRAMRNYDTGSLLFWIAVRKGVGVADGMIRSQSDQEVGKQDEGLYSFINDGSS